MTELVKQLVEEVEKIVPKNVYVVYSRHDLDYRPVLEAKVLSVHRTKEKAFEYLFSGDIGDYGVCDVWYSVDEGERKVVKRELMK